MCEEEEVEEETHRGNMLDRRGKLIVGLFISYPDIVFNLDDSLAMYQVFLN